MPFPHQYHPARAMAIRKIIHTMKINLRVKLGKPKPLALGKMRIIANPTTNAIRRLSGRL